MLIDASRHREYPGLAQRFAALPRGELIVNRLDPGATLPQHDHEHVQFGFSVVGEFDLFVGEHAKRHTIGSERAYILGPNALHSAAPRAGESVLSIDLKVLVALHQNYNRIPEEVVCSEPNYLFWYTPPTFGAKPVLVPERPCKLPELSFCEPLVERFEWGRRLSYDHPWWRCRYVSLNPYRRVRIETEHENRYVVVAKKGNHREFGRVYRLGSPTVLESDDAGLLVVCVALRSGGNDVDGNRTAGRPRRGRSPEGSGGRRTKRPESDR